MNFYSGIRLKLKLWYFSQTLLPRMFIRIVSGLMLIRILRHPPGIARCMLIVEGLRLFLISSLKADVKKFVRSRLPMCFYPCVFFSSFSYSGNFNLFPSLCQSCVVGIYREHRVRYCIVIEMIKIWSHYHFSLSI